MISINLKSQNLIEFKIDSNVYNDTVISKVLYWLSGRYIIGQQSFEFVRKVSLEKIEGVFCEDELLVLKKELSQKFIDFKTRDIIQKETKTIRELLIIKAFANDDEFDDYNLLKK